MSVFTMRNNQRIYPAFTFVVLGLLTCYAMLYLPFIRVNNTYYVQIGTRMVKYVDCRRLVEGDKGEIEKANKVQILYNDSTQIDKLLDNCANFITRRGYNSLPVTEEETNFPIAFSILYHDNFEQVERLLRAIYRPQNTYCLQVDIKASPYVHKISKCIAKCLPNVFISTKSENIIYGSFSRLKAEVHCMHDLIAVNTKWTYLINLPGTVFPIRTNSELVKILKIYNGSNDIEGIQNPSRMLKHRFQFRHEEKDGGVHMNKSHIYTAPPHNITITKGSAYGVFSRKFVKFILHDKRAVDLLEWSKYIGSPDEYYWATLNHDKSLMAPGGYWGKPFCDITSGNIKKCKKVVRFLCTLNIL